ncbi:hypothetical protein [Gordonia sp. N1V]|uniref:hypothetical protein n=1 Tax=Gordonia sp. N1V TaxID=3034163 RepID=UPI0023E26513|nr:hypothetical protein [Gordonia sp. N1V]MDF3280936.1 hypothetical protein [Gordonia sp. N1V]
MKANKAIWASVTSGAAGLLAVLTLLLPYIPGKVGFALLIVVLVATPVVVYLVPNWDKVKADAEKVIRDAETGNVIGLIHDGTLLVRADVIPALKKDTSILSGGAGYSADSVANVNSKITEAMAKYAAATKTNDPATEPIPTITDQIIADTKAAIHAIETGDVPTVAQVIGKRGIPETSTAAMATAARSAEQTAYDVAARSKLGL